MIISDLNHLEVISEELVIMGGKKNKDLFYYSDDDVFKIKLDIDQEVNDQDVVVIKGNNKGDIDTGASTNLELTLNLST